MVHADGRTELYLENGGTLHARIADVRVLAGSSAQVLAHAEGFHYVLPQARQRWILPPGSGVKAGPTRIAALTEDGPREFELQLQAVP